MSPRVTMAQIAERAGVHVTTVSMALRNHPAIRAETRERLQQLAATMGYRRDPALAALVAYRYRARAKANVGRLAYITNLETRWAWKHLPAHREFHAGASEKAAELGYQLEHFWLGEPGLTQRRLDRILYARGIKALILASQRREVEGPLDFDWSRLSAVKIDVSPIRQPLHVVTNDQRSIIMLAMRHAVAAGYRRIGLVMPRWWDDHVNLAWSSGYLAFQQKLPARDRLPILSYAQSERPWGSGNDAPDVPVPRATLDRWLQVYQPEVLLSYEPFVARGLAELNLSVPRDLAYADIFLDQPDGRVAGVHQNCTHVGGLAVEILVGQIQNHVYGIPSIPTATIVEGIWHDGESLPARPDRGAARAAVAARPAGEAVAASGLES